MTGIIGAMPEEVAMFKDSMEISGTVEYARMTFYRGVLKGQDVVLLHSGVGKVNAAIGTQIMIDRFDVQQILFTGLAGSLVPYLSRGDVVVSNYVVQYDFDLTAFGRRHGELPNTGRMIEADPRLVKFTCFGFDDIFKYEKDSPKLVVGTIVSGDRFVSDKRKIEWLQREFGAVATEMEGAAVGYTCFLNDVPFVVLRTISDSADDEAASDFEQSLHNASENSFRIVSSILEVMSYRSEVAE
ncbi:MAG: 5'-methylthioadenosine/adenosylhomocysteine nucleosidase [candidate division Zixibacteria bacterium]|nr:5'-methylthioadenosine/adenosylhomocysteine nucleosidase [candidate division Zixibacteria bacterium]